MEEKSGATFWDHLDVLRFALLRSVVLITVLSVTAFCFKEFVFDGIILAPAKNDFFVFRFFEFISQKFGFEDFNLDIQPVKIINTKLSAQLFIHLSTSFYLGFIAAVPYILGEIWFFLKKI